MTTGSVWIWRIIHLDAQVSQYTNSYSAIFIKPLLQTAAGICLQTAVLSFLFFVETLR